MNGGLLSRFLIQVVRIYMRVVRSVSAAGLVYVGSTLEKCLSYASLYTGYIMYVAWRYADSAYLL